MKNAAMVMDIIEGRKHLTIMQENSMSFKERNISFTLNDPDNLSGEIAVSGGKKVGKRVVIPLALDEIEGLQNLLFVIAAFVYPESNSVFQIYDVKSDYCLASYSVERRSGLSPSMVCRYDLTSLFGRQ